MKITIFGATGLLGKCLMQEWTHDQVIGLSSKDADIRNEQQVQRVVARDAPDWIVLAAAFTDVDGCETHREQAYDVNCRGALNVARAAILHHARLLFVSTDYVFDGMKATPYESDDSRAPQSVYGKTKADAEIGLLGILPDCCIVRTSWLFGVGGKCFPDTILRLAATRSTLDVVNDQRGCPTYSVDLARAIIALCRKQARGILHATDAGECTWFEFAREILREAGSATEVRPTTSDKFVRPAPRPKYSVLSAESLKPYDISMPTWQDALSRYLVERRVPQSSG